MTILDTNVLSEVAAAPSEAALAWILNRRLVDPLFITTITVAEMLYGIEILAPGRRREKLKAEAMFSQDFARIAELIASGKLADGLRSSLPGVRMSVPLRRSLR